MWREKSGACSIPLPLRELKSQSDSLLNYHHFIYLKVSSVKNRHVTQEARVTELGLTVFEEPCSR